MADLIDRQAAINTIDCDIEITGRENAECVARTLQKFINRIKALPSVDAVEVVQCKDCYHYDEESEKCILNNSEMKPMDYCSYGSK